MFSLVTITIKTLSIKVGFILRCQDEKQEPLKILNAIKQQAEMWGYRNVRAQRTWGESIPCMEVAWLIITHMILEHFWDRFTYSYISCWNTLSMPYDPVNDFKSSYVSKTFDLGAPSMTRKTLNTSADRIWEMGIVIMPAASGKQCDVCQCDVSLIDLGLAGMRSYCRPSCTKCGAPWVKNSLEDNSVLKGQKGHWNLVSFNLCLHFISEEKCVEHTQRY